MIFKSQQVNLDPKPWAGPNGVRTSYVNPTSDGAQSGDWNYLPRPEFEPTRDPLPWYLDGNLVAPTLRADHRRDAGYVWAPRRDQFDTPVNRILVAFRNRHALNGTRDDAAEWLEVGLDLDYTAEEFEHARRVLTRIARL